MFGSFLQYTRLVSLIIRHGRLYPVGEDYNQARNDHLADLQECIPAGHSLRIKKKSRKPSTLQYLKGQAAFIKNAFKLNGGHLTAAQLSLSYIRIPKSASTSTSLALLQKVYPSLKEKSLPEHEINFLADVNLQNNTNVNENLTYFTIVRNPFARLVSVYHDFFETSTNNFIYSDYLFGILQQSLSFSDFIDRISIIPDRLKDQHIKPQHCFLTYYAKKGVSVKVLKLEEQEKASHFFSSYSIHLTHRNKSKRPYRYEDYYTPNTLRKVFNLYRTDIDIFGYQQAFEKLFTYLKDQSKPSKTVQN